ncbi:SERINE/THREONINE-PROTEIN KINASE CDL1-LIKE [Salix koriyanagi]|uniref:SERINE/THREONINE-PROTEIN KINASE CDL1-LIKE n=1 Tax=Salix koriyanagi TaxID=2511006 RepID=A0A9Q0P7A2_9ROSI|nr:SERINE/THREONINE-PROTEIN KINASE CDL1-LIKE [Salix koriyanagi]
MEPSTTDEPARSHGNHANKHHSSQSQFHDHHHGIGTLSSTSILIIIVSSISVVVVLTIFLIIAMLKRFKYSKDGGNGRDFSSCNTSKFIAHTTIRFTPSPDVKGGCLYGSSMGRKPPGNYKGVQVFTYKELEIATNKFSEANVAGNEGYGVVYRGTLSDGTVAAIKMLHRGGKQGERAFRMEVDLLSRLYSPYLVELLGYCADQNHRLLVFEFMPNGTLQHHLHHRQCRPLNWGTRLRIALDCARALEFLHELTIPAVIHRDFKCSNIFLDQNFRAKVSDFGLAKMGSDRINSQNSMHVPITTGYLAPEYASTGKLTTKSDVYSYGVVLLQLLTGRKPVDTKRPSGEHVLVSWALPRLTNRDKVVEMVDPTMQDQYSKKDLIQVAAIAAVCVQPEADYRPLMTDVVQSLIPLVKNLSSVSSSCSSRFMNQMLCSSRPM